MRGSRVSIRNVGSDGAAQPEALPAPVSGGSCPVALAEALEEVEIKYREDAFRFRTCCADPRASK